MKRVLMLIVLWTLQAPATAQLTDVSMAGQRIPLQVTMDAVYQSVTLADRVVTETSVPLSLYLPLHRNVGLSVRGAWARARGDSLAPLTGITDAQAHLSLYQPVGSGSVVAAVGVNLPSGKQALTLPQFETLTLLSRNQYDFRTPSFGLGMGVSPGLTVAFPIRESVVVGLGAAYQYRRAFEPLENMAEAYRPGNEVVITGGFDVRFSPAIFLSADVTYTTYQADRVGDAEIFTAGDKVVLGGQLRYVGRLHQVRLTGRYRSRAPSSLAAIGEGLAEEAEKTFPDQVEVFVHHRSKLAAFLYGSVLAEARLFDASTLVPGLRELYGLGVGLEIAVSPRLQFPTWFLYQLGDFTGFEAGMGLRARL